MILTKEVILNYIKRGKITIKPFNYKNLGAVSVDLTLDDKFGIFKNKPITIEENTNYKDYINIVRKKSLILKPKEMIIAITKERITLNDKICGWIQGRSRFARLGLLVHISASFIQPGINNKQVLEIVNLNNKPIRLKAGVKIAQIIFEKLEGRASYEGKFKNRVDF